MSLCRGVASVGVPEGASTFEVSLGAETRSTVCMPAELTGETGRDAGPTDPPAFGAAAT
ncbi:MAG TPA: hypothetical protein VMG10_29005 [Gemmataceae bacterium]|nr:hypothetical protein [Gemmataceae bacterium]